MKSQFISTRLFYEAIGLFLIMAMMASLSFAQSAVISVSPKRLTTKEDLSEEDKRLLFESLTEKEKQEWLSRSPDLTPDVDISETLPSSKEKAIEPEAGKSATSRIETILSGQFPTDITRELRQYGYDFFPEEAPTYEPLTNIPVGEDYIIGPGDEFSIHLWGKAEYSYDVRVSRDGNIMVPRLGSLNISGLTFKELKPFLSNKFREYYPEFEMNVTMGRLRSINIFLVGEAKKPGTYEVHSLSTIISALNAAGGPSKNGSLRNIKLIRNSKAVTVLDLYDFFIAGDRVNDVRLQDGDTLFIPVLGPVVGIAGDVRRPAIYELGGDETINDVIKLAGGVLPTGHLQNVVVERISGHQRRVIKTFNLDSAHDEDHEDLKTPLKDGDVIKVYPVYAGLRHTVFLEGHVKYPREFELKSDMRVGDIISSYDDLRPEPYLPRAEILRLMPPDLHPEIIEFDLGALLAGDTTQNLSLQELDRIRIYAATEKMTIPHVTIFGAVRTPGSYRLYSGMKVKDLIFLAGNLTSRAYGNKGSLARVLPGDSGTETVQIVFSPSKAMDGLPTDNIPLEPDDTVHIREIPQYKEALERKVHLEGEFLFPGEYSFSAGDRLSSVIQQAGGLTEQAYPFGAVFLRESVKEVQKAQLADYISTLEEDILTLSARSAETAIDESEAAILEQALSTKRQLLEKLKTVRPTGRMVVDLEELLAMPLSEKDFKLSPGDRLIVNEKPDYVNILGEVYNPTAVLAESDMSVGYYLNSVGGPTDDAKKDEIYVVKADGTVISKAQGRAGWDKATHRWTLGGFNSIKIDPGDTIIVPKQVEESPYLRMTKDITTIIFQIAITAGVFIAL